MFGIESFSSQLLKGYYLKKSMYVCKWTEELQGMIDYLALEWQNNFFPCILVICGMTFKFEYLGEFKFIFKNNLGAWSWAQKLAFVEKKWRSKISYKCTFKIKKEKSRIFFQIINGSEKVFGLHCLFSHILCLSSINTTTVHFHSYIHFPKQLYAFTIWYRVFHFTIPLKVRKST